MKTQSMPSRGLNARSAHASAGHRHVDIRTHQCFQIIDDLIDALAIIRCDLRELELQLDLGVVNGDTVGENMSRKLPGGQPLRIVRRHSCAMGAH